MSSPSSTPPEQQTITGYVIAIHRSDRWVLHQRLQDLQIPSSCPSDGTLRVDIRTGIDILLIRSTVQRMIAPRTDLITWLERCWSTSSPTVSTAIVTHQDS